MFNKHPKGLIPAALSNMGERFRLLHHERCAGVVPLF